MALVLQWIIHHVSHVGIGGQWADKVHRLWRAIFALMPQLGGVTQAFLLRGGELVGISVTAGCLRERGRHV